MSSSSERCPWNSFQSCTRSRHCRATGKSLEYSMNPVALPISVFILESSSTRMSQGNGGVDLICRLFSAQARQIVRVLLKGSHRGLFCSHSRFSHLLLRLEHSAVVPGDHSHEPADALIPRQQNFGCAPAPCVLRMTE